MASPRKTGGREALDPGQARGSFELPILAIRANSRQPRAQFEEEAIEELADSIRRVGVLQPLIVRPLGNGGYELIAGERRLRASKLAGLMQVPVVVRPAGAQQSLEMALIENIQRVDISPIEAALAYRSLIDEFGLTQEQIAETVGKSRVAVTNTLRLLRLPPRILAGLREGMILEGHARALLAFDGPAKQLAAYEVALKRDLTVRQIEAMSAAGKPLKSPAASPKMAGERIENALSEYLGSPVRLRKIGKARRIEISIYDDEDLDRILDLLGFSP